MCVNWHVSQYGRHRTWCACRVLYGCRVLCARGVLCMWALSVHVASLVCAGHCVPVESPVHRCVKRTPCSQGLLRVSVGMPVGSNYVEGARCRDRSGRGLVWGGVHTCGNEGPLGAVLFLYVCVGSACVGDLRSGSLCARGGGRGPVTYGHPSMRASLCGRRGGGRPGVVRGPYARRSPGPALPGARHRLHCLTCFTCLPQPVGEARSAAPRVGLARFLATEPELRVTLTSGARVQGSGAGTLSLRRTDGRLGARGPGSRGLSGLRG